MKEVTLERFPQNVDELFSAAQRERILVTRNGKPVALVVGLENKDEEDFRLEASPDFWRMIEERRHEPTVSLKDLKAELFADDQPH